MNKEIISHGISEIDPRYITEATLHSHRPPWIKWGGIAACLAAAVIAVALLLPQQAPGQSGSFVTVVPAEQQVEWPWEYKTEYEKYTTVTFGGSEYTARGREITSALLGEALGLCRGEGFDIQTGQSHPAEFTALPIRGLGNQNLLAVEMEGQYWVYLKEDTPAPGTLGEFLEEYGMCHTLPLKRFSDQEGYQEIGHYSLAEDGQIWNLLSQSGAGKLVEDGKWSIANRPHLSFTITSESLGVYKRAMHITEDGFLWTNLLDRALIYEIGVETAGKIIEYARAYGIETEPEPYEQTLAGTLTEIGEDYVLLDDSVTRPKAAGGVVYRVAVQDLRLRRCVEYLGLKTGDVVVLRYDGIVDKNNVIIGGRGLSRGRIIDGAWAAPE